MTQPGAGARRPGAAAGRPRRHLLRWAVAALLVVAFGIGAWVLSRAQHAVDTAMQGRGGAAFDILVPRPLNGEETGRVNLLLVGNSFDDRGHEGAALTDSIIVASMDLATRRVVLVSIPRDLWVEYGDDQMKINAVYPVASSGTAGASGLGDSSAGLTALSEVVTRVTGLRIDHHVLVGYTALQEIVDAVGGIDVVIDSPDPRGIWDPASGGLRLANGPQHLDGRTALALSRARNHAMEGFEEPYGIPDAGFGREANQRMVLGALMDKVRNSPALANPATMVAIFDSVSVNVRSNLTVSQVRRVYDLTSRGGDPASVSLLGDGTIKLLRDYDNRAVGASDALVPTAGRFDYTELHALVAHAVAS
nr:LCP family protein [Propionibacterium sp.]